MPVKVKVVRVKKYKAPAIKPPRPVLQEMADLGAASIIDNVRRQKQADGSSLKINVPRTRKYKKDKGWTVMGKVRSLIAEKHRFVKIGNWNRKVKGTTLIIEPKKVLAEISKYVQRRGYIGWFDISEKGMLSIQSALREWLKKAIRQR